MKKRFTEEHKLKLSISHMGNVQTQETKDKISQTKMGVLKSDETKQRMSIAQKKVKKTPRFIWLTPFGNFGTTKQASECVGKSPRTVYRWCTDDAKEAWSRIKNNKKIIYAQHG